MCEYLFFYTVGDKKNILGCMEGSISKIIVFFMDAFLAQSYLSERFEFFYISQYFFSVLNWVTISNY
jgi:hypothetical protein